MNPKPAPDPACDGADADLTTDVLIPCELWIRACDTVAALCCAAADEAIAVAVADGTSLPGHPLEVAVMLGDDRSVRDLNRRYRHIDKPTNVLSFANLDTTTTATLPDGASVLLGDIVVAFETVDGEARSAGRSLDHHLAHMIVHGVLHLLGYDHETDPDAVQMETLEVAALARLGIASPYAEPVARPDAEPVARPDGRERL